MSKDKKFYVMAFENLQIILMSPDNDVTSYQRKNWNWQNNKEYEIFDFKYFSVSTRRYI